MRVYEILLCIKNFKDGNGKLAFRPSQDIKEYTKEDGTKIKLPSSYYRNNTFLLDGEENEEEIEIRAADHGTVLKLWDNVLHPAPWNNYYNLDIEFLDNATPQNNLDGNRKFFVVDQWIYDNTTILGTDVNAILSTIISLGGGEFTDPTGKVAKHYVLTPNDENGNDITDRSSAHKHQLAVLSKHEQELSKQNESRMPKRMKYITESHLRYIISESIRKVLEESSREYGPNGYYIAKKGVDYKYNGEKRHSVISVVNKSGNQRYHIDTDDHCYVIYWDMDNKEAERYENPYIFDELLDAIKMLPRPS